MIKSKFHRTWLAVALAGGLIAGATSAYATPGTIFVGTNTLLFDTDTANPGQEPGGFLNISSTELEWVDVEDDDANTSFLRILSPANVPVNIVSDFGWFDVAHLQHENNIIPVSSFTFDIDVLDQFTLGGATFALTGTDTLPLLTLPLTFLETPNIQNCPAPNPVGTSCDDTFVISNLGLAIGSFAFTALGEDWNLSFQILAGLEQNSFFNGVDTIYTGELGTSNVFIQARIDQLEVPEPATLALLGIGLMGLPLVRRVAKKAGPLAD